MSAVFDVNSLSREELDQISQLIHKKTMMLDKNYFQNNDDVMKFISRVAMKSESRESFWRRLSTKLDSMPVALQNSQALSTHSTSRDMDIFLWFQKNLKKLQSLLGTLSARGTENILLGKLTEALNIATHCANVSTLSGPQLCLLRELHTAFYSRSANGKQNNSQSSSNSSVAVSSSGPLVSGKNLSPPTFLSSSSAPVAMRAYTGPNLGPLCGPIPNSVSSMPSNGRFLIAADATQLQDHCLQERRQKESDWISNFYKKVYAFQRLLHNKGCAADKSVESKIDIKGLMCGLHDVIVASEGMGKDLGSLIGDSSLTGNALNGFLTIVKRFLLVITLEISTKVTDENQKETGSMNEGNREISDLENKSSNYGDYIPLLNLVKAAICSIRLGKYSISTEDTIAENNRENMKRKTSILINSVNKSEESHRSLGVYPSKRKQYAGFINQR